MDPLTIWRRRILLMLAVGLVTAIPATLVIRGSSSDRPERDGRALAERFPLNPAVSDRELGASYRVPEGWRRKREGGAVTLRSAGGSVRVGITSPGPASESARVLEQALGSIQATYEDVGVNPGSGRRVGGLPARGAVVTATADGSELRILVAVTEGEKRAHLVEVFTAAGAPARPVAEAQRFLDSLTLER